MKSTKEIKNLLSESRSYFCSEQHTGYFRDFFPSALNRWIPILQEMAVMPRGRVLDIGCGYYGPLDTAASRMGFEVHGVDTFNRKLSPQIIDDYGIEFHECNIEAHSLPYNDNFFNIAILSDVLEHFNYSPEVPLKEICRVLKKGGYLFLTTPNIANITAAMALLMGNNVFPDMRKFYIDCNVDYRCMYIEGKPYNIREHRMYTMDELYELLDLTGFKVTKSRFLHRGPSYQTLPKRLFRNTLCMILKLVNLRILGDTLFVMAQKETE